MDILKTNPLLKSTVLKEGNERLSKDAPFQSLLTGNYQWNMIKTDQTLHAKCSKSQLNQLATQLLNPNTDGI